MASNAVICKSGTLTFSGSAVVEVRNIRITKKSETIDTSSMSSGGNRERKFGMNDWSGSFEVLAYNNSLQGSAAVGSFCSGTAASSYTPMFSGTVLIGAIDATMQYDKELVLAYSFEGSGPCTAAIT
jgi:predicted secreted protein